MKYTLTALCIFTIATCMAQANKPGAGDFGIRYGVQFNGSAVQGLTFSGMVTGNIEVGCTVNVQYANNASTSNTATYQGVTINNVYTYLPAVSSVQSYSKTINAGITPFVFYHIKIKSNVDVYAGPGFIIGTGQHIFINHNDQVLAADQYLSETATKTIYPLGYQVGGTLNIGGQYFFYNRLALGVQAAFGVTYTHIVGTEKSEEDVTNAGANNNNKNYSFSSTVYAPYVSKVLSVTTASSIGVNLTFYVAQKAKKAKEVKAL